MIDRYIRQYGKRLYGLCRSLCASPHDADDLYQETWLKALRYFDRYDTTKPFEPWVTKIYINTYRNFLRRNRLLRLSEFSSVDEKEAFLQAIPAPPEKDYEPLYEAIENLPEKLRLTVILFYFREMDTASVAEVLGIPIGTVKSRLNKARNVLKEALKDETDL